MKFSIEKPTELFEKHLEVPLNERIIFSAPFGSGKTYFLRAFFENSQHYDVVHLFPVNYSVASNEDVFELIKYDILFELLGKDLDYQKLTIPHIKTLLKFAKSNGHSILAPFIKLIPGFGKSAFDVQDKLQKLSENYLNEHDDAQKDEKKSVLDYLEGFTKVKGSIYEEDFYTQLICQLVDQISAPAGAEGGAKKQSVLILDDLDRIDPDHLFRILNVLSAQIDQTAQSKGNKFNFDKVIVVFDKDNVHRIFQNRYGSDVDFSGYIDKFYSHKVFEFDNYEGLEGQIAEFLATIQRPQSDEFLDIYKEDSVLTQNVIYVLNSLLKAKQLTIRRLIKIMGKEFKRSKYKPIFGNVRHRYVNRNLEICFLFEFLFMLYGSWDEIIDALAQCEDAKGNIIDNEFLAQYVSFALVALKADQHRLKMHQDVWTFDHDPSNQRITYDMFRWHQDKRSILTGVQSIVDFEDLENESEEIKYFPILLDTAKKMKEWNSLQFEI